MLLRDDALFGTGQLPKFGDDLFRTTNGYWLSPTAEVPLTNLVAGEILAEASCRSATRRSRLCFRAEAGAAGKDTRGMLRQHQFEKCEMVSIAHPEEKLGRAGADGRLRGGGVAELGLPYRVVTLCSGDTGAARARPTTWRSGCRGRGCTGRSPAAPTPATTRPGG